MGKNKKGKSRIDFDDESIYGSNDIYDEDGYSSSKKSKKDRSRGRRDSGSYDDYGGYDAGGYNDYGYSDSDDDYSQYDDQNSEYDDQETDQFDEQDEYENYQDEEDLEEEIDEESEDESEPESSSKSSSSSYSYGSSSNSSSSGVSRLVQGDAQKGSASSASNGFRPVSAVAHNQNDSMLGSGVFRESSDSKTNKSSSSATNSTSYSFTPVNVKAVATPGKSDERKKKEEPVFAETKLEDVEKYEEDSDESEFDEGTSSGGLGGFLKRMFHRGAKQEEDVEDEANEATANAENEVEKSEVEEVEQEADVNDEQARELEEKRQMLELTIEDLNLKIKEIEEVDPEGEDEELQNQLQEHRKELESMENELAELTGSSKKSLAFLRYLSPLVWFAALGRALKSCASKLKSVFKKSNADVEDEEIDENEFEEESTQKVEDMKSSKRKVNSREAEPDEQQDAYEHEAEDGELDYDDEPRAGRDWRGITKKTGVVTIVASLILVVGYIGLVTYKGVKSGKTGAFWNRGATAAKKQKDADTKTKETVDKQGLGKSLAKQDLAKKIDSAAASAGKSVKEAKNGLLMKSDSELKDLVSSSEDELDATVGKAVNDVKSGLEATDDLISSAADDLTGLSEEEGSELSEFANNDESLDPLSEDQGVVDDESNGLVDDEYAAIPTDDDESTEVAADFGEDEVDTSVSSYPPREPEIQDATATFGDVAIRDDRTGAASKNVANTIPVADSTSEEQYAATPGISEPPTGTTVALAPAVSSTPEVASGADWGDESLNNLSSDLSVAESTALNSSPASSLADGGWDSPQELSELNNDTSLAVNNATLDSSTLGAPSLSSDSLDSTSLGASSLSANSLDSTSLASPTLANGSSLESGNLSTTDLNSSSALGSGLDSNPMLGSTDGSLDISNAQANNLDSTPTLSSSLGNEQFSDNSFDNSPSLANAPQVSTPLLTNGTGELGSGLSQGEPELDLAVNGLGDPTLNLASPSSSTLNGGATLDNNATGSLVSQNLNSLSESIAGASDRLSTRASTLSNQVNEASQNFQTNLQNGLANVEANVNSGVETVQEWGNQAADALNNTANSISETMNGAVGGLTNAYENTKNTLTDSYNSAVGSLEATGNELRSGYENLRNSITGNQNLNVSNNLGESVGTADLSGQSYNTSLTGNQAATDSLSLPSVAQSASQGNSLETSSINDSNVLEMEQPLVTGATPNSTTADYADSIANNDSNNQPLVSPQNLASDNSLTPNVGNVADTMNARSTPTPEANSSYASAGNSAEQLGTESYGNGVNSYGAGVANTDSTGNSYDAASYANEQTVAGNVYGQNNSPAYQGNNSFGEPYSQSNGAYNSQNGNYSGAYNGGANYASNGDYAYQNPQGVSNNYANMQAPDQNGYASTYNMNSPSYNGMNNNASYANPPYYNDVPNSAYSSAPYYSGVNNGPYAGGTYDSLNYANNSNVYATNTASSKTAYREYITKEGDNLLTIAQQELGSSSRWGEIKKLNNLRSGATYFNVGTRIKLPVSTKE